jgi:hypothetical protein
LLKLDVIEKVEGPTSWVNPLVVVEKPNGDIRICLDMRQANQAIVREKHPVPTVEETLQEVSYAKVFSKLENLVNQMDKKALLKTKFPKVFQGLGKLKGFN